MMLNKFKKAALVILLLTSFYESKSQIVSPSDSATIQNLMDSAWVLKNNAPDSSFLVLDHAWKLSSEMGFQYGKANTLYYFGIIHYLQGNYPEARNFSQKSDQIYERLNNEKSRASIQNLLGLIHQRLGEYPEAIEAFQLSHSISKKTSNPINIANPLHNIGLVYERLRDFSNSLEYTLQAYRIRLTTEDPLFIGQSELSIGSLYFEMGQTDSAHYYLSLALRNSKRANDLNTEARILNWLGLMSLESGNYQKAIQHFQSSDYLMDQVEDQDGKFMTQLNLGIANTKLGNFSKASKGLKNAQELLDSVPSRAREADYLIALAELQFKTRDFESAFHSMEKLQLVRDSLYDQNRNQYLAELETRFELEQKENQILKQDLDLELIESAGFRKSVVLISIIIALLIVFVLLFVRHMARLRRLHANRQKEQFQALIQGEEQERARLALELHDGLGQLLAMAKLQVSHLKNGLDGQAPSLEQTAEQSMDMIDQSIREVRQISHNLMPPALERNGWLAAVRQMVRKADLGPGPKVSFAYPEQAPTINKMSEVHLYRIAQELLANAIRHAEAEKIELKLVSMENRWSFSLQDDGKGMDPKLQFSEEGLGWKSILSRASWLNGKVEIKSKKPTGTLIELTFPKQ